MSGLRIVVLGYIIRGPIGGLAWHHLQYVDGLRRLGHDVRFVEDSDDYPACYDPSRHVTGIDPSYGLRFAQDAFDRLGLGDRWSYFDAHSNHWHGSPGAEEFCRSSDIVLNLSGVNPLRDWTASIPRRAFVDTDPLFTQIRNLTDTKARSRTDAHNVFLTFGENIGTPLSLVPDDGFRWSPTRQPIVLSRWNTRNAGKKAAYTTVMQWSSYPSVDYEGMKYGTKDASFAPFLSLPASTAVTLEIALGGDTAPRQELIDSGWQLRNPLEAALTPWDYQDYIGGSRGEFTLAKHGYVVSRSGWFSERTAAYLASGKPAIVQETGFSDWMKPHAGVIPFTTPDEAVECLQRVEAEYGHHSRCAREMAEEFFDSDMVLSRMIETITA